MKLPMNNILRVFPRRNSYTPDDTMVWFGFPPIWPIRCDEVHISVAFTWDKTYAEQMRQEYARLCPVVKVGGPAIGGEGDEFEPGMYLRKGITITTRGCPNHCPWCLVKDSPFREIPIRPGWIIQDNNILAARKSHFRKVVDMLNTQRKAAVFRGGLDTRLLTPWHINHLQRLKHISELWFACDSRAGLKLLFRARPSMEWLPRRKKRCYVLLAYNGELISEAKARLEQVWELGFLPFAQLYQPPDKHIEYGHEWRRLAREWSRPAAMFAQHKATEITKE